MRSEFIPIVAKCLERQTFKDYEWIVVAGKTGKYQDFIDVMPSDNKNWLLTLEPEKKEGDYYALNKAWNEAYRLAKGDLIVSIVDGLWFDPTTLERLYAHYQNNPRACVSCIGHQYSRIENDKPEQLVWNDPRANTEFGSFYEVKHTEMELCVASFPRQAVIDVGGVDEEFDKYAALSEKEMMARMYKAGYTLWLDQTIEYRAIQHPRLSKDWDERFQEGVEYYNKCMTEIAEGKRLSLDFVK